MGKIKDTEIAPGMWAPIDEDEWKHKENREKIRDEVLKNRKTMEIYGPDTSKEARKLVRENELPDQEFDPKDFGDELIESPPKAGEK